MNNFCTNCGHANKNGNTHCEECGSSLVNSEKVLKPKKKWSKKEKVIGSSLLAVLVCIFSLYFWGSNHASAESVANRFKAAVEKNDVEKLEKILVFSDGTELSSGQVKAFLKLLNETDAYNWEDYISLKQQGKFLGVFDNHKVIVIGQTLIYELPYSGLSLKLNGEEIKGKMKDSFYEFGPIAPGIYKGELLFEGHYAKTSKEFTMTVNDYEGYPITIYEDLGLETVVFYIDDSPKYNTFVKVMDQKIPFNEDGETEEIGLLPLDEGITAQLIIDFPWGELASPEVVISESYQYLEAGSLNQEVKDAMFAQLLKYGEEYVKAWANRDANELTTLTPDAKSAFSDEIEDMINAEVFYTGQLQEIRIDEEQLIINHDGTIVFNAELVMKSGNYLLGQTPDMEEDIQPYRVTMQYDENAAVWLIADSSFDRWIDIEPTKILEGSKLIAKPSDQNIAVATNEKIKQELSKFIVTFNELSVRAINERNYNIVEHLVTEDGPRRKEQSDYIEYLASKGITETHVGTTLESLEKVSEDTWKITSVEEFIIYYPESSSDKKYRTQTLIKNVDGEWLVHQLVSTTEI